MNDAEQPIWQLFLIVVTESADENQIIMQQHFIVIQPNIKRSGFVKLSFNPYNKC
ncbi:hypothetical protein J2X61_002273 [Bacillus sp. 3255]|nr:hypothetical protein [Bacillus sp. 3255]